MSDASAREASDNHPLVSIVIVAHSVRDEVERCLQSIEMFASVATETILVDNASTDDTVAWVRTHHPRVTVIELDQNIGMLAREHGLRRSRGRYLMVLDSDAALTPGALPTMVEALERNPTWGLVGPRLIGDDGELQLSCRRFPPPYLPLLRRPPLGKLFERSGVVRRHLMMDFDHSRPRKVVYVLGACQLFRVTLAAAAGYRYSRGIFFGPDDIDWCIRVRDAGGDVVYLPSATVIHSYRRATAHHPLSRAALRHLRSFAVWQWQYRGRYRELTRLGEQLDREAA